MRSSEGLPGYTGMRLVEDLGVVQRYEAVDGEGVPVSVLVLGEHASRDPQQRAAFVQQAMQASVAALPGQLPITCGERIEVTPTTVLARLRE